MPGVLWCPLRSCSVASEVDLPALARSSNASKTDGFVCVLASFALAPPTGVEPVTFGLGRVTATSAPVSIDLQPLGIVRIDEANGVQRSQRIASIRSALVTSLLQTEASKPDANGLEGRAIGTQVLSVREVAARLRVCTATVYDMIERNELEHVRVSNAIRVLVRGR